VEGEQSTQHAKAGKRQREPYMLYLYGDGVGTIGLVGYINDEFTIKYLDLRHRKDGYIELRPANKDFKPIRIDEDDDFEVWGVVVYTIKKWK